MNRRKMKAELAKLEAEITRLHDIFKGCWRALPPAFINMHQDEEINTALQSFKKEYDQRLVSSMRFRAALIRMKLQFKDNTTLVDMIERVIDDDNKYKDTI